MSITDERIEVLLCGRLSRKEINTVVSWCKEYTANRERLIGVAFSDDKIKSANALWCITHLRHHNSEWLLSLQDQLIDRVMIETTVSKKRMLLQLLREQEFSPESVRPDFLDFCFTKINSESEPYAIRCFCIYISYKLCMHYPELLNELKDRLEMLSLQDLSPGLKCARRKVSERIKNTLRDINRMIRD